MNKRIIALTTAAALVAAPVAVLVAGPAQADGPERHARGTVAGATYDISAEKERGFEVSADLEGVAAGSTWKVVVKHDGTRIGSQTLRAVPDDGRHEVDFRDFRSANTAGKDVFTVKIKRVDGAGSVTRTLTFAR
ncbi:MAG: hypothetical protein JWN91_2270 [Nocardioides sp.]|jgi:hypothetical protein|nr:hypothetical protein [Nocardioides sp.]